MTLLRAFGALATLACSLAPLAVSALFAGAAAAQDFVVGWSGDRPDRVYLDRNGQTDQFSLDEQSSLFKASIQTGSQQEDAVLAAEYSGSETLSLPIRVLDYRPVFSTNFRRLTDLQCTNPNVLELERGSVNFQVTLQRYFDARELAERSDATRCGRLMRPRVVKAWFDRSYALASANPQFRLDPDAIEELSKLSKHDREYVDMYDRRATAALIRFANDAKLNAIDQNNFAQAIELNNRLISDLEGDSALREDVRQFEGLTVAVLRTDAAFLDKQ
jgi:hypothetical protein